MIHATTTQPHHWCCQPSLLCIRRSSGCGGGGAGRGAGLSRVTTAGLSALALLDAIAAATAPQLRDFKPQGLAITAWAFDTTNRALGGGDGTVVVWVVPTLDASDMAPESAGAAGLPKKKQAA